MPRAVANATKTIEAVNGVEYDKPTDGYEDDFLPTSEQTGRYKILTPRAHSFTSYGIRFVEGIGVYRRANARQPAASGVRLQGRRHGCPPRARWPLARAWVR